MSPSSRRGRRSDPPVDDTPLDAPTIDVEARTGFLLRHGREFAGERSVPTGSAMVAALARLGVRSSNADVSHWEKGVTPASATVIEAYEQITGAPPGLLRGIIDTLRRCYRGGRLPPRRVDRRRLDLAEVTARCEVVLRGSPRGIDWLHFADLLNEERVVLPAFLVDEPTTRLVSEMSRSVAAAYLTRYEALASILDSPYGARAQTFVQDAVLDERTQVLLDPICVLAETPVPDRIGWLAELLADPRPKVVLGAAYALDVACETGRLPEQTLDTVAARVLDAYLAAAEDRTRDALVAVIRSLPAARTTQLLDRLDQRAREQLRAVEAPVDTDHRAALCTVAARAQRRVVEAIGADREQPMLTRLLYEALFEPRPTRRFHAVSVLQAVPYVRQVVEVVTRLAHAARDDEVRRAAVRAVLNLGHLRSPDTVLRLVRSDDEQMRRAGLVASAHCQLPLDRELLAPLIAADGPLRSTATYAAGMTGHPLVAELAADPAADPAVRTAAQWWRRAGTAVLD
ncbi:hypothetical protein [Actinocatenispora comari]|uniref:HEAT repeat domain-containing protein n=1 Tax=Actinocatenispora comari TaxID=2807577 RepID=A0A8J4A9D6_9ACTN|nr:hypothetical protein [Actinocatenispora comari]GIL24962.1 hypothetical protein NUM_02170 [Actinocatenispora comari]